MKLRFRKNDPYHNLLTATQHWIEANGGKAVVIGGAGVIDREGSPMHYYVAVSVTGRKPQRPALAPCDPRGHNTRDGRHCEACGLDLSPELPIGYRVDLPWYEPSNLALIDHPLDRYWHDHFGMAPFHEHYGPGQRG